VLELWARQRREATGEGDEDGGEDAEGRDDLPELDDLEPNG